MVLILGGAWQGKLTWARSAYGVTQVYDLALGWPERPAQCCNHLEQLTYRAAAEEQTAEELLSRLLPLVEQGIVISREIGSGVVPVDPLERRWRELHGAVLQALAAASDRVSRIFCGLEERLK